MDIIVTTPKDQMVNATAEAQARIASGGGWYFRTFRKKPKNLQIGDKVWYVEDGAIRGFLIVHDFVIYEDEFTCEVTGRPIDGHVVVSKAKSWKWVKPIAHKGFQGYRYFTPINYTVIGDWLRPRPE